MYSIPRCKVTGSSGTHLPEVVIWTKRQKKKKKKREVWHCGMSRLCTAATTMDRPVHFMVYMGWPDFLIQPPPPMGLCQDMPDYAGHNPATEHLCGADHRDHDLLGQQIIVVPLKDDP